MCDDFGVRTKFIVNCLKSSYSDIHIFQLINKLFSHDKNNQIIVYKNELINDRSTSEMMLVSSQNYSLNP